MRKVVLLPHETSGSVSGVRTSDNTERPFVFADIQTTGVDYSPFPTILTCLVYILCPRITQTKMRSPTKYM